MAVRLYTNRQYVYEQRTIYLFIIRAAGTTMSQPYTVVLVHYCMDNRQAVCVQISANKHAGSNLLKQQKQLLYRHRQWVDELSVSMPCTEGSKCPCLHYKYNTKKAVLLSSAKRIELHKLPDRLCVVRVYMCATAHVWHTLYLYVLCSVRTSI